MQYAGGIVVCAGLLFFALGTLGLLRFPDFYTRMHAAGKFDTLGSMLALGGLALLNGFTQGSLKILLIAVFIFFTSPTATHSVARAAHKNKLPLWTKDEK